MGMDSSTHEAFLRRAVALSLQSVENGDGGPFGAVIVKDGKIVGEGRNRVVADNDPTAHAEVLAIRAVCQALSVFHLEGCVLYTSCEPCPMCLAAAYWARIERIYYANTRDDAASIGFCDADLYCELERPGEQRRLPTEHVPLPEALEPLRLWRADPNRVPY
jgi:guanine deaminase